MTFGEFLQRRRLELGLTQRELADQLGVSNKTISRWETDSHQPYVRDREQFTNMVMFLGTDVAEYVSRPLGGTNQAEIDRFQELLRAERQEEIAVASLVASAELRDEIAALADGIRAERQAEMAASEDRMRAERHEEIAAQTETIVAQIDERLTALRAVLVREANPHQPDSGHI